LNLPELRKFDVEIISTGGTATTLGMQALSSRCLTDNRLSENDGWTRQDVAPRVHGALLALRDKPDHVKAMVDHGIKPIDMVVVNLYPFETNDRARRNV